MKRIHIKLLLLFLLCTISVSAQQKLSKTVQSLKVDNDVAIDLNTSHTNIEIDTWNKSYIEIEAYVESEKLSKAELKKILEQWVINVSESGDKVIITSKGSLDSWNADFSDGFTDVLQDLQIKMANLPEMPEMPEMPVMPDMTALNFPDMPKMPELPELPEGMSNVNFNFELYKKDGEKYLEKWGKEYNAKYGKDYKDKMRAWADQFNEADFEAYEKKMEAWGEKFGKEWEQKFGKDFQEKMEKWGNEFGEKFDEEFGAKMEAWGKQFEETHGKQLEEHAKELESHQKENEERYMELTKRYDGVGNQKVKKTIKIKMPKKAKLNLNVKHGEFKLASIILNMKGDISHGTLLANSIDGGGTSINVSYSGIKVSDWKSGDLNLKYVENAVLTNVENMMLNAVSSNVDINNLSGNAVIDGSFGDLKINNISETFNNLNIVLENSDAALKLPKTDFNLFFKGNRSHFNNENIANKTIKNQSNVKVNSNKTIVINAKYSNVVAN